jgi:hypothetical protein
MILLHVIERIMKRKTDVFNNDLNCLSYTVEELIIDYQQYCLNKDVTTK